MPTLTPTLMQSHNPYIRFVCAVCHEPVYRAYLAPRHDLSQCFICEGCDATAKGEVLP